MGFLFQYPFILPFHTVHGVLKAGILKLCASVGSPGGSDGKESAHSAGDLASIPGLGRSPREGNGKPFPYSYLEKPMNNMKRQKDRAWKDELPRSVGAQYATGDQWRNNSRKNEGMEPKQKQHPVKDVTGDGSKV